MSQHTRIHVIPWTMLCCLLVLLDWSNEGSCSQTSEATGECLTCHEALHPGIVQGWRKSHHARVSPSEAQKKPDLERRMSGTAVPDTLQNTAVGCFECHGMRADAHKDSFEHNGYTIHIVVSPDDCATCHEVERRQYRDNTMSFAHTNLVKNGLYQDLIASINSTMSFQGQSLKSVPPNEKTNADSCLFCHGTSISITGSAARETDFGEMTFPILSGWPNQGVGRINPDGSAGSCTSCHPRHDFSIAAARKPAACAECHIGPDVPAYKVFEASKHGAIYTSQESTWTFDAVPWTVGKDFSAPTCAACHASLLVNSAGEVMVERSHAFTDRIPWRILGLIYAHPHAAAPDNTNIRNSAGIPLPTELSGEPVAQFVITSEEQTKRKKQMQASCRGCHSSQWIENHWSGFENTIAETNAAVRTGTQIMAGIWEQGLVQGLPQKQSIFDDAVERTWTSLWLFYANTVRFASAMAGGGDYGVFANGRYFMSGAIMDLKDWMDGRMKVEEKPEQKK